MITQGKTLAFVLPIIESLVNGRTKALRKTGYGRLPSVLVLLPTRELATQVLHGRCASGISYILLTLSPLEFLYFDFSIL